MFSPRTMHCHGLAAAVVFVAAAAYTASFTAAAFTLGTRFHVLFCARPCASTSTNWAPTAQHRGFPATPRATDALDRATYAPDAQEEDTHDNDCEPPPQCSLNTFVPPLGKRFQGFHLVPVGTRWRCPPSNQGKK